jgi:peroxiredoxin Q/BCP
VSKDSVASHTKFADKFAIPYALAADTSGRVCEAFETWVEKNQYGRKYMGVDRATFLIDAEGRIAQAWRKVRVVGHAKIVLEATRALA